MQTVLVTGAAGFIGRHLCGILTTEGYDVVGVDRSSRLSNLPEEIHIVQTDLSERPTLPPADTIVHLAAHSQVQPTINNPELGVANVVVAQHVLAEAERLGAGVVNVSSREIFGSAVRPTETAVDTDSPNPYAASKLASEAFTNSYRNIADINAVSIRLANVYGPNDQNPRVLPTFVALANDGEMLTVFGQGKVLDFVHVEDACRSLVAAVERITAVDGESITVGSGRGQQLEDLARLVAETVPDCPGWKVCDDRTGDVSRFVADLSRARGLLDYEPEHEFETGVRDTVEYYLNNPTATPAVNN